jgi:hypothetical protein
MKVIIAKFANGILSLVNVITGENRPMIYIDYLDKKSIQNCPSNYVILAGNGELFRVENSKIIISQVRLNDTDEMYRFIDTLSDAVFAIKRRELE